jgi:hypothetical protein
MLSKKHLSKFIREHGLVEFSGDRVTPQELIPVELYSIQELHYLVGEFFDRPGVVSPRARLRDGIPGACRGRLTDT